MRIVHVTQFFMPWLGYLSYYLPREQIRAGHEVTVVASNLRWPGGNYSVLAEPGVSRELPLGLGEEHGVPCVRLETHRLALKSTVSLKGLSAWLTELKPDVVIAYLYASPTTLQVALLQKALGFRLFVVDSQLAHQSSQGLPHRVLRRLIRQIGARLIQPRLEGVVTLAEGATDHLAAAYGVPRQLMSFIPLGIDPAIFRPDAQAASALRDTLGYQAEDYVIGYTGKLAPVKQVEALIDAVGRLRERLPAKQPIKLLLVGKGEPAYVESLRQLARTKHVELVMHESVPPKQLATYFNVIDVCVWPADCSISHLEAAACGTPIVIPGNTGVDDRVAGDNGLLVQTGDSAGIAAALERLAEPAIREEMGANGVEWMRARYHWSAICSAWSKLLTP